MSAGSLKSQKSSVNRAFRQVAKARGEVQEALETLGVEEDQDTAQLLEDLAAKMQMLKTECDNADRLMTVFEQTAAEAEDESFTDTLESWENQLFEAKRKIAQGGQLLTKSKEGVGTVTPASNADQSAQQSESAPDRPTASANQADFSEQFARFLELLETRQLASGQQINSFQSQGESSGGAWSSNVTRLPKLELPKFKGDLLKWRPFWDRFEASVDKNPQLSPVDKLNYLVGMLEKEPLMLVQNLPMTTENYETAKVLLKEKYGDERMIIAMLYRKLNNLKPVQNEATALRHFVAEIDCLFGSLGSMGQNTTDDNLVTIIFSKLPTNVVIMLEMAKNVKEAWTVQLVRKELSDYLQRIERAVKVSATPKGGPNAGPIDLTGHTLLAGETAKGDKEKKKAKAKKSDTGGKEGGKGKSNPDSGSKSGKPSCAYCEGEHYSDKCTKFKTADERFRKIGNRCRVCLSPDHHKKDCQSQKPCFYCKQVKSHHSSLCFKKFGRNAEQGDLAGADDGQTGQGKEDENDSESDSSLLASGEGVTLQTAKIPVKSGEGRSETFVVTRALFDPGANRTYCSQHLARQLGMKTKSGPKLKVNRFGSDGPVSVPTRTGVLQIRKLDGSVESIEVSVIDKITGSLVRSPVKSKNLERLKTRVRMADEIPKKTEQTPIDLLIGNDYYLDFITGEKITVDKGLYLLGSEFGYILSGRSTLNKRPGYAMSMCGFTCGTLEGLDDLVAIPKAEDVHLKKPEMSDFWSLGDIGIKEDPAVTSDDLAVQDFEKNVSFENGRYSVSLPWNDSAPELGSDYKLSVGRLNSLVKRLKRDGDLFETYNGVMQDQLAKGVIEKVDPKVPVAKTHYIPHHAVVEPQRETTKVRVVYDGSAKVRDDRPSLNECLHRGPVLLEDLIGLLLRFRTNKIAIISDIEKAFLQIGINPSDRDMLRFLWLKDPKKMKTEGNVQVFRFARVVFGLNCSPFLLIQTVRHHLEKVGSEVANQIRDSLYADNVITGVETLDEGKRCYHEAKDIFRKASMNLRQWTSNSAELMKEISLEDHIKSPVPKVLGLPWLKEGDTLGVAQSSKLKGTAKTKRELLSQLSAVFDPLGFFTPVTIPGKVLLQEACQSKPDWDTELERAVTEKWEEQRKRVLAIPGVQIPRYVESHGVCTLVAFSDASSTSFATAVYLRCEREGIVTVNLLMSKARLNPVKKVTIPRLELLGVLIGVRALNFVASQMKLPKVGGMVFTDSSCTLAWLKNQKQQDVFVRNRVKEIAKSKWITFRYVNTDHNPADWATRGKEATKLTSFWWNGPDWLRMPKTEWPNWDFEEVEATETGVPTGVVHQVSLVSGEEQNQPLMGIQAKDYSSHERLVRVTAWCLRFLDKVRKKSVESNCLTSDELDEAQRLWEIRVQTEAYGSLKNGLSQETKKALGQLTVFQDHNELLRCRARMEKSRISWEAKFPMLLPKSHPYTSLLVDRIHRENGHASAAHTLSLVRLKYWIPKGRQLVKSVIHRCVTCRKASGQPFARPEMPELPSDRVVPQPPFTSTGVDYFGPIKLKGRDKTEKAWVALFTCLTTRAVHLELVLDLSAEEFLMALRRFIARRGKPSKMLSDNAPQFKAVAKTAEVTWNGLMQNPSILNFAAQGGIKWTFITEYAPYMGGVYERLVGIVKVCLRKTIGPALLTPKQFETLLCECEAIVNTRPLSYVSSDLDDGFVLTPAHFLSLNPRIAVAEPERQLKKDRDLHALESSTLNNLLESWNKGQNLLTEFWRCWKTEYLSALREKVTYRHKHNQGTIVSPKAGDVVLMKEIGLPRGSWKIAKISKVHLSADGQIRSATVNLPSGRQLHRPVHMLIPLEVKDGSSEGEPNKPDISDLEESSDEESSGRASPEF